MPDAWYQVRKKIGDMPTLPQGVIGPFFNDEFGDVYGTIYALTADGFSQEELRFAGRPGPPGAAAGPTWPRSRSVCVQAEKLFVEISQKRLAQLGLDFNQVIGAAQRPERGGGAGVLNAGTANLQVRVQGQFNRGPGAGAIPIRAVNPGNRQLQQPAPGRHRRPSSAAMWTRRP